MQRIAIITLLILGMGVQSASAQLSDRLVPHFGFMLEMGEARELDNTSNGFDWNYSALNIGSYIAIVHARDVVSLGIDPSVQVGLNFQGPGTNILLQTPVYGMVRVGAGATPYNQQSFGISLGAGFNAQHFWFTGINRRSSFIAPSFVGEVTIVSRGSPLTGRIHFSPGQASALLRYTGDDFGVNNDINYQFGQVIGLGIVYGF